ncbi:hypothetical protein BCR44DRAFT_1426622 [Catenaria anguillulae PL171]|uniref:Eukaryotic translation initiation factor 3 subunit E n=1 Tax=Catenaria anguillulae PL171 TaxID=765915 RepID=A0A1Y2HXX3_9FUNG|nr:hypothetical protein BCR44DRAFT_1426622 [Catenaria anguillulae PL171]
MTAGNFDLTPTIAKYLDPQLVYEVLTQAFDLINDNSSRADFANELADAIENAGGDRPDTSAIEARAKAANEALANPDDDVSRILDVMASADEHLRNDRATNGAYIREHAQVEAESIDKLFVVAKAHFEVGKFEEVVKLVDQFRRISTNYSLFLSAAWAKLASALLSQDNKGALEAINRVRDSIEHANLATPSHTLEQRLWLMHWALFVVFQVEGGLDRAMDIFVNPVYGNPNPNMNAIETAAPWLLRYIVAASILTSYKNTRDIARYASQERYRVSDPLCQAYEALYWSVDLDAASAALLQVAQVAHIDYFLAPHAAALLAGFRKQFLGVVSTVYSQMPKSQLVDMLHLKKWEQVVELLGENGELANGAVVAVSGDDEEVVQFTHQQATRKNLFEKVDKLSHRSDNAIAELYKKL